ncbi:hypothetical protein [Rhizorhapis sp. SPR117]|uniref:hypothetical protein n=1 Tax=Rhizorhapis sp. SPR117 TaxID=2912611 RepID=UPI001F3E3F6F|nr:hypothetical protein [Rhizorhapis sp. SPR117]
MEDDDGGDDRTDQARAFRAEAIGAGDCASAACVAQDGAQGDQADDAAFTYTRVAEPRPKLGGHAAALEQLLAENERKPRRERLTLIRLYEVLRGLGFEGGYVTTHPLANVAGL